MGIVKRWFMVMRSRHPEFLEVVEGGTACQLANLYGGVLGLPEIFLIGPGGKVIRSWRGDFKSSELDATIATARKP